MKKNEIETKDKTEKTCDLIRKQKKIRFTGELIINFLNGKPVAIKKATKTAI